MQRESASECRYRESRPLDKDDTVLGISQSGETADTLAALRIAREHGVPVLGLCNVVGSSIARESSAVIYTQAGPEISVASTKAMCSQMLMLALVALYWGGRQGIMDAAARARQIALLESLPSQLDAARPATSSIWAAATATRWRWRGRSSSRSFPTSTPRAMPPAR